MNPIHKILTACAVSALPLGAAVAGNVIKQEFTPRTEVKAADSETKTIQLKVVGMR
jgi:hypothetical protein